MIKHTWTNTFFLKLATPFKLILPVSGLLILSAVSTHALAASSALKNFSGQYTGVYKGTKITLNREFKALGNSNYSLKNKAKNALASLSESSSFNLNQHNRMRPSRYVYSVKYGPIKRGQDVVFDWKAKVATDKKDSKKRVSLAKYSSAADRLSYQAQLRQLVKSGKRGTITLDVVSRGSLKKYTYKTLAPQTLKTQAGTFKTIPVKRIYRDAKRSQTVWLATEHDYVLLKLSQRDGKEKYEISLNKGSLAGKALK